MTIKTKYDRYTLSYKLQAIKLADHPDITDKVMAVPNDLPEIKDMKDGSVEYKLREFQSGDEAKVNEIALAAFDEYRDHYDDWDAFSRIIGNMASLSESGKLIVATLQEKVVGAVVYVGIGEKKSAFFSPEWPILRMLVVEPSSRGLGIGRALTEECIRRAERDGAPLIALHTSPVMAVALPMYESLGFEFHHKAPMIFGVPYGIYVKELAAQQSASADNSTALI